MAKISKILHIITQSELGGAQRYVFDLASNLPKDDFAVTVAAGGNGELLTKCDEAGVSIVTLKHLVREINPIKDWQGYLELKKLFKEEQPDIVHLNSSKAGVLGAIAAKRAGVPKIIYTVHGFVFNEPMPSWKKFIYILAEKFSAKYKTKLICVSEFDRQVGIKNKITAAEKFVTINNGLEELSFLPKEQARQELNLPQDKFIVGTIANFYETKGLNYLIEAAKIVTDKLPNIIFRLIGFGNLENKLKEQIKNLNLENKFFLEKKVDGYKYLKAFDAYALSSVKEGLSYTILEAMSARLPIVATEVGGTPEMINEQNGILVEPKSPQALAEGIIKLIEDKNLANELAAQAELDVKNNFSLEKMLEKTLKVYKN